MKSILKYLIVPFTNIDKALPSAGTILDLGCGEGIISFFLAQNKNRRIIGIDKNLHKIRLAQNQARCCQNISFTQGDIFKINLPPRIDGVILSDMLHHLSIINQQKILLKISLLLKKGGILVVKEINRDDMIRSKLSRLWDAILYPQDKINYYSSAEIIKLLKQLGFQVRHQQTNFLTPASVHLYIAKKL